MTAVLQPEHLAEWLDETHARSRWVQGLYVPPLTEGRESSIPISDEVLWGERVEREVQAFDIGSGAAQEAA